MEIFKTKDANVVKIINEISEKYIEKEGIKDYKSEHLLKWLRYNAANPLVGIWVCIDDDTAKGFAVALMQAGLDKEYVVVSHMYAEHEEVESDFLKRIEEWSKKYGINEFRAVTKYPKRWKEYGYVVSEHILRRET